MTLHLIELREAVGMSLFFEVLQEWSTFTKVSVTNLSISRDMVLLPGPYEIAEETVAGSNLLILHTIDLNM